MIFIFLIQLAIFNISRYKERMKNQIEDYYNRLFYEIEAGRMDAIKMMPFKEYKELTSHYVFIREEEKIKKEMKKKSKK